MGLLNNPSENKQILSGNRKGLLFSNIEAVDNFFIKKRTHQPQPEKTGFSSANFWDYSASGFTLQ